jgi:anti-sigma factor (TIGR02949 family)
MSCQQALERLLEFIDGELSGGEHDGLERHLLTCRTCWSRAEFEKRLKERLSDLPSDEASAAARERIRALIRGF